MISQSELSMAQLESWSDRAGWMIPAGYIIAKEGTKPICFNKDLAENLSERKCVGAVVVAGGHRSGTIDND